MRYRDVCRWGRAKTWVTRESKPLPVSVGCVPGKGALWNTWRSSLQIPNHGTQKHNLIGHQRQCYTWGVAMVRVVDAGVKGSAQRGLCLRRRGSPAPWPPLIAQLLFSSPLGSSIGKPHLRIQHQLSPMTNTMTNHKHINSWLDIIVNVNNVNIYIHTYIYKYNIYITFVFYISI